MTLAVAALSHAPWFGRVDPGGTAQKEMDESIAAVRAFVDDFAPDLVIAFGPDHFNGVLYEMMPPFAIGAQAEGVGDWGTRAGTIPVDSKTARALIAGVLDQGIDIARSERLRVDHGILQPVEFIFGSDFEVPIVPIFVNSVGWPLTPLTRVVQLGEAVARAAAALDKRVLMLASGGMSHDPPMPDWDSVPPAVQEKLTSGQKTREERAIRESGMIQAIQRIVDGEETVVPHGLNAEWDNELLDVLRSGDFTAVESWTNQDWIARGGVGSHECRTWLAAFAGLATAGSYRMVVDSYWALESVDMGFAIVAAVSEEA